MVPPVDSCMVWGALSGVKLEKSCALAGKRLRPSHQRKYPRMLRRYDEAKAAADRVIELDSNQQSAYGGKGAALITIARQVRYPIFSSAYRSRQTRRQKLHAYQSPGAATVSLRYTSRPSLTVPCLTVQACMLST